jgi:hypothetical protein
MIKALAVGLAMAMLASVTLAHAGSPLTNLNIPHPVVGTPPITKLPPPPPPPQNSKSSDTGHKK